MYLLVGSLWYDWQQCVFLLQLLILEINGTAHEDVAWHGFVDDDWIQVLQAKAMVQIHFLFPIKLLGFIYMSCTSHRSRLISCNLNGHSGKLYGFSFRKFLCIIPVFVSESWGVKFCCREISKLMFDGVSDFWEPSYDARLACS